MADVLASAAASANSGSSTRAYVSPIRVTVGATAATHATASAYSTGDKPKSASASAGTASLAAATVVRLVGATCSATATATASASATTTRGPGVSGLATATAYASASPVVARLQSQGPGASASSGAAASAVVVRQRVAVAAASATAYAGVSVAGNRNASLVATAYAYAAASEASSRLAPSTASAGSGSTASAYVVRSASASASAGSSSSAGTGNNRRSKSASASAGSSATASATKGGRPASASAGSASLASAVVEVSGGLTLPGGSVETTLKTSVYEGVSGSDPFTWTQLPNGDVLLANGVDPVLRWSPQEARVSPAGLTPPQSAPLLGGSGVGTLTGLRVAYVRWVDDRGNVSNLSPVSNAVDLGFDKTIEDITTDAAGVITVYSRGHGLAVGGSATLVFSDVQGLAALNGAHAVTVVDRDSFTVSDLRDTAGQWTQGGSWTWGVSSVTYSALPTTADPKVVRRQILRNAEGNLDVLYVDIDTTDLTSTNAESSRTDESLISRERVPVTDADGLPAANRHSPPPSHKRAVCAHMGRTFLAVDASYSEGCVTMTPGRATVQGVGTAWRAGFAGRQFFAPGTRPRTILSVDAANQVLALDGPLDPSVPSYSHYTIRPPDVERRLIYYSEPGEYESFPEWNAISIPDDGDRITGLFSSGPHLYAVESGHVYRVVFSESPAKTATAFQVCRRGCVNHKCIVRTADGTYMLDEQGVHAFNEQGTESVSWPVQNLFRDDDASVTQINWEGDRRLWHGSYDPPYETVRWFVHMDDDDDLYHALCYHIRLKAWWVEEYPFPVRSTSSAKVQGHKRTLAGIDARRVVCLWGGSPDISDDANAARGRVSSATSLTVVDDAAPFPANLAGIPVAIAAGTGAGQVRVVSDNTADTITTVDPWDVIPDGTSVYQVGGVSWWWKSPWYRLSEDQESNPRNVEVLFKPLKLGGTLAAEYYFDQHETPEAFGYDKFEDRLTIRDGSPRIEWDMADRQIRPGFAVMRTEGHQDSYAYPTLKTSVKLYGVQGAEAHRIYSVTVLGAGESDD